MKSSVIGAAVALALTLAPASQGALAQDSEAEAKPVKEKKVCRSYKVTGSLTRRTRICRTQSEWDEVDRATYKGVSDMQGSAGGAARCVAGSQDMMCNSTLRGQ